MWSAGLADRTSHLQTYPAGCQFGATGTIDPIT